MKKDHLEDLKKKSLEVIEELKILSSDYPSLASNIDSTTHLLIKSLNKDMNQELFSIINTKLDDNKNTSYVTRNNNKTLIFNHTNRFKEAWFSIKKQEKIFSFKPDTFDKFGIFYKNNPENIDLLEETLIEIKKSIIFFKTINLLNRQEDDEMKAIACNYLIPYLNKETQLAITLTMNIEVAKMWVEKIVIDRKEVLNYEKEITDLFNNKIEKILDEYAIQSMNKRVRYAPAYYSINNTNAKYRKENLESCIEILTPHAEKANLYYALTTDLDINITKKKHKI